MIAMSGVFLFLGGVLIGFSVLLALFILARTWPGFEPVEPDLPVRWGHYLAHVRAEWRLRPAWKGMRYAGVTGLVWVLAGLLIPLLPQALRQGGAFTSIVTPMITYGPVLLLFFYDQWRKSK
jgi:hypothetical protein